MKSFKLRISYQDRVGIVNDVSKIIAILGINILSLQVCHNEMYLEIEIDVDENPDILDRLHSNLQTISQVISIEAIKIMPFEAREKQLKVVLDSIGEGVLAIDHFGKITTINPAAERILKCTADSVLGRPVKEILGDNIPILNTLKTGVSYFNKEINIRTPKSKFHFYSSGIPIKDKNGDILGAVATLKDISEVKELYHNLTRQRMCTFDDIVGNSHALKHAINSAKSVAKSDSTVCLRGESGTGKELFARAIHMESWRCNKPFVPVNCAALPGSLLESELFGYTEGAFTGAKKGGKPGLFEFAGDGTIFLDEIGEISSDLQAKLLRVLQENAVRRVGATEETPINCRVIVATNKNLEEMVSKGLFREDFYYRINVVPIHIPPLRERREDIPILVNYFLKKIRMRVKRDVYTVSPSAMQLLLNHYWPGNVRELENVIERAVNLAQGPIILPEHILLDSVKKNWEGTIKLSQEKHRLADMLDEVEKAILEKVLQKYPSSRKAAEFLDVSHTTILNKIKKYKLSVPGVQQSIDKHVIHL